MGFFLHQFGRAHSKEKQQLLRDEIAQLRLEYD